MLHGISLAAVVTASAVTILAAVHPWSEDWGELYRLIPPRRPHRGLREALDAITGRGLAAPGDGEAVPTAVPEAGRPGARRPGGWIRPFLGSALANAVGPILAAIVIASVSYLFAHHVGHTPARQQTPAQPPAATAHP